MPARSQWSSPTSATTPSSSTRLTTAPPTPERLRAVAHFAEVSPPALRVLADIIHVLHYDAGKAIFWEGEPATSLFVVVEGAVKICRHATDGREHILHLLQPFDTFNDVGALDGGDNPATAIAHSDATVWSIPRVDLIRIAQAHPELSWALLEAMARRARHLVAKVEDLSMRSVKGRLARLLLEEASKEGDEDIVPRHLTQEEIANQLGTVREMIGRALRNLADDGIIVVDRHQIKILDVKQLTDEAMS